MTKLRELAIHKITKQILTKQFQETARTARQLEPGHFKRQTDRFGKEYPYWAGKTNDGKSFVSGMTIDELPDHDFSFKGKPSRFIGEEKNPKLFISVSKY